MINEMQYIPQNARRIVIFLKAYHIIIIAISINPCDALKFSLGLLDWWLSMFPLG